MSTDAADRLHRALVARDAPGAIAVVESARSSGVDQAHLFDEVYAPALALVARGWADGRLNEYEFAQAAIVADQVLSFVTPASPSADSGVTVVTGCAPGERHSVRNAIIAAALRDAGHRVIDLGADVDPGEFPGRVREAGARILVLTAEMVAPACGAVRVREALDAAGCSDVVLLVAGAAFEADDALVARIRAAGAVRGAEDVCARVAEHATGAAEGTTW